MAERIRNNYEYGNVAHDYSAAPERRRHEVHQPGRRARRARRTNINIIGLTVVAGAFAFFVIAMVNYVQLQSNLTSKVKTVSNKQIALSNLQSENDEHYSRIVSSVDLNEIERIARGELGMTYASEGQIINYTSSNNDYMRRTDDN